MTIIASAIAASVGSAVLGALPASVAGAITGAGIGAGTVGAITIGGTAAGIGGMAGASAADANKAKQADQRQGAANAAVSGAVPSGASNLYAASTPATPIASGEQKIFATGGITALAKGGHGVRLEDSDYIIPADVVSALGNGSSKAGARYLQEQLARLNSVGGVGALPPSKSLRATREAKKKAKA